MKMPKRGERGFTLIELLIVVAILGILAAVVVPNVGRFLGRGEAEAMKAEYHDVGVAVSALMTENNLSTIPNALSYAGTAGTNATTDMSAFPDTTSNWGTPGGKVKDPNGTTYQAGDKAGYLLFDHDKTADNTTTPVVRYLNMKSTKYYYTCEGDGTIRQWKSSTTSDANEVKY